MQIREMIRESEAHLPRTFVRTRADIGLARACNSVLLVRTEGRFASREVDILPIRLGGYGRHRKRQHERHSTSPHPVSPVAHCPVTVSVTRTDANCKPGGLHSITRGNRPIPPPALTPRDRRRAQCRWRSNRTTMYSAVRPGSRRASRRCPWCRKPCRDPRQARAHSG